MRPGARHSLLPLVVSWHDLPHKRAWYLDAFVPKVMELGRAAARNDAEWRLIHLALTGLVADEWRTLPELVAELASDAERERVLEKERLERQVLEGERDLERRRVAAVKKAERLAAQDAELAHARVRARLLEALERDLWTNFLQAETNLKSNDPDGLISADEFCSAAARCVTKWWSENLVRPDGPPFTPDPEQAAAIATVGRHAMVGARAGSGKTATMVARSIFLIKHCGVAPASILMLAFNTAAADEMRERLEKLLPGGQVPHVMTFHALAHRLVHPAENLLFDSSDSMRPLSTHVQDVVNTFLHDPDSQVQVREVMLAYFQKDWSRIAGRGDDLSAADQLEYRAHLQDESIKGDFVKSYGEKVIANVLFINGIAGDGREAVSFYGYEHDVRWNGQNYKPDFSIYDPSKKRRVVIEYFGMLGEPDYDRLSEEKRAFWKDRDEVFLEYFPADVAGSDFEQRLLADLREAGAPLRRLSDEELWHRIKKRAIDRFTEAVTTLIGRARQRRWIGEDLQREWNQYDFNDTDLDHFVELAAKVLDDYSGSLVERRKEDFTGLLWRAVDEVRSGTTSFGRGGNVDGDIRELRHIVVDEFQDFSLMFFELLQAVLTSSPDAHVMAVGDDWQAINEFAGSTTEYFASFEQGFQNATRMALATNRRSAPAIVTLGNAVMIGKGAPAVAKRNDQGLIREFKSDTFEPSPVEAETFGEYDRATPALLRLIQSHRAADRKVAVLSRKRRGSWSVAVNGDEKSFTEFGHYGAYLRNLLRVEEPAEVQFSSTHGFKGQEAEAVILLEVTQRNYPLIHPTWTLFQVFGDTVQTLTEAERRLFYVGVSRPHVHLDVITTNRDPSHFWTEARDVADVLSMDWEALPEVRLGLSADTVEVRVVNSGVEDFDMSRNYLKADRFRFRGGSAKYWWRLVADVDFDEERLMQALWAQQPGVRIAVWRDGRCVFTHRQPGGSQTWAPF